jgi:hypothetical protein
VKRTVTNKIKQSVLKIRLGSEHKDNKKNITGRQGILKTISAKSANKAPITKQNETIKVQ